MFVQTPNYQTRVILKGVTLNHCTITYLARDSLLKKSCDAVKPVVAEISVSYFLREFLLHDTNINIHNLQRSII